MKVDLFNYNFCFSMIEDEEWRTKLGRFYGLYDGDEVNLLFVGEVEVK